MSIHQWSTNCLTSQRRRYVVSKITRASNQRQSLVPKAIDPIGERRHCGGANRRGSCCSGGHWVVRSVSPFLKKFGSWKIEINRFQEISRTEYFGLVSISVLIELTDFVLKVKITRKTHMFYIANLDNTYSILENNNWEGNNNDIVKQIHNNLKYDASHIN